MNHENDLTLVVCAYNCSKYIKETLNCIIKQTFRNFDLLIVNDGSTDDSVNIIEQFFERNPRQYILVNLETNQGIAYARNLALILVKTKYMMFVDADDMPHPELIDKEYTKIKSDNNIIGVSSWSEFIDLKGRKIRGGLYIGNQAKDEAIYRAIQKKMLFLPIQTLFDRQSAIDCGGFAIKGFPEGQPRYQDFCEDVDLWTRMSDLYVEGKYLIVLPEILYKYRKRAGLSSKSFNMIIKMRYVKENLLRRRSGQTELTFIQFYESLGDKEIKRIKRDASIADSLRNAVFLIRRGRVIRGAYNLFKSIVMNPRYFIRKVENNLIK